MHGTPPNVSEVEKETPVGALRSDTLDWRWWNEETPIPEMPKDFVVIVAERTFESEAGKYRLETLSDDGIRVLVDGVEVLEDWTAHAVSQDFRVIPLAKGEHNIRVEYFEEASLSRLGVWLRRVQ
jgi:hypothetical protein